MVAAIDLGLKRIGVAAMVGGIPMPLSPIIRKNRNQAASELLTLLKMHGVTKLVVGIPIGGSSEDEMRRRATHFVSLLDFEGEVFYVDESFSSSEAGELLKGVCKDKRDGKIDSLAAKILLERWAVKNAKR